MIEEKRERGIEEWGKDVREERDSKR